MAAGDVTWAQYTTVIGEACTSLRTGDYLTARIRAVEAKMIANGLGSAVTADRSQVQLAIAQANSVLEDIEKIQAYAAIKAGSRFIRVGLADNRRNNGGADRE